MLPLPDTRRRSWEFYAWLQNDCFTGSRRCSWWQAERELGRTDLFYLMVRMLRRPDVNKDWLFERCREVQAEPNGCLDLWAREHYKDLADDTPILTHNRGWVQHGQLMVGDWVYDDAGKPREVLALSTRYDDSECYRLTFSDGAQLVAGAGHLWRVRRKHRLRVGDWRVGRRQVVWDEEVISTENLPHRADVGALEEPVAGLPQQLPIDPYVLGAWLGDGSVGQAKITASASDADAMVSLLSARGIEVGVSKHSNAVSINIGSGVRGKRGSSDFRNAARALGVLHDKHIPEIYLRASAHQRMMLLRGLMDTDGTCNTRGTATFVSKYQRLAEQVFELAAGLALRPRLRPYVMKSGPYVGYRFYQVAMQSHLDRIPFAMARKMARAIPASDHRACRDVVSIERVDSVPTRCIQVEGGVYVAGRELIPTHNSTIITFGLTIQDILNDPEVTVGIFSHTRPIAKGFLLQIKREFEDNETLKELYPDVLWQHPQRESPRWSEDGGLIVRRKSNPKEATIEAWGLVDGQPTSKHFKRRIYDDTVTRESVTTPEQIQKTTDAWELSSNLGVQEEMGGAARYIGTRYALYDTYSVMLQRGAVKARIYPATHNGRMDGNPVFLSAKAWGDKLRDNSRSTIASQQLQNPMADSAATFMPQWLKSYEVRPRTLNVYIMCDPSRGRLATSDNTAIAVVGMAGPGAKFLLDGVCHRMTLSQRWVALRNLYRKWKRAKGVQHIAVGYERYGAQSDDEYFAEQMDREKEHFVIEELNWPREGGDSKKERVERLEPDFRNARFFLPREVWRDGRPMTWRVDVEPESRTFGEIEWRPNTGLTSAQMRAIEGGSEDLISRSIKCMDQEGKVYDLTDWFIQEYIYFPFGQWKDLIDATSRLYDMDARGPVITPDGVLDPVEHWDR